uniref:Uncharacterized protein n=1 Tax=Tanacetum cinerariifolium TaxID=118510 RepID=A0A699GU04_TANCI|nr:hypothetical protein [Tanacetum cinerariifolium]
MQNFIESTNENLQRHELTIKKLEKKVVHLALALANRKGEHNTAVMNDILHASVQQECKMKVESLQGTPTNKMETFSKKVKNRIMETQANEEKLLKKLEIEPVNTTLVNDIRKTPEYTRKTNAHARIDVFGGKISLEVGKEQFVFNANEGATPTTVLPVCVIKFLDVLDNIEGGNWNPIAGFQDSNDKLGIDDFMAIDDLRDDLDPGVLSIKDENSRSPRLVFMWSKDSVLAYGYTITNVITINLSEKYAKQLVLLVTTARLLLDHGLPALFAKASEKERKAQNDQYNRCSKKLSRVVSPTRLE